MKAAIEQDARLAERREAVRLARQQEAQVTRMADNSRKKINQPEIVFHHVVRSDLEWYIIGFLSRKAPSVLARSSNVSQSILIPYRVCRPIDFPFRSGSGERMSWRRRGARRARSRR